jgi:hypothetical protein
VLLNVLTQLIPYIGYPRTLNALRVLDEALSPTVKEPLTSDLFDRTVRRACPPARVDEPPVMY